MQPYFFPYIGYFSLIKYSDMFVFFDTPQYIHHGWINRNRILKQDGEFKYIVVPIQKRERQISIKDIIIDNGQNWRESIYGGLSIYKKKAPYYDRVMFLVREILETPCVYLSELNINGTVKVCEYLEIKTPFNIYSKMEIDVSEMVKEPDEWALYITKELGYGTYVNPPGGDAFFEREKYEMWNIELQFLKANIVPYIQKIGRFVPSLSIIDVMMFCGVEEIQSMLDSYIIY